MVNGRIAETAAAPVRQPAERVLARRGQCIMDGPIRQGVLLVQLTGPVRCRPGCHSARKTSSRSLRRALSRDGGSGRSRRCWRPRRPWRPLPYRLFHRSGRKSIADSESYAPYMVSPMSGSTSCGYNTGNASAQTLSGFRSWLSNGSRHALTSDRAK